MDCEIIKTLIQNYYTNEELPDINYYLPESYEVISEIFKGVNYDNIERNEIKNNRQFLEKDIKNSTNLNQSTFDLFLSILYDLLWHIEWLAYQKDFERKFVSRQMVFQTLRNDRELYKIFESAIPESEKMTGQELSDFKNFNKPVKSIEGLLEKIEIMRRDVEKS